MRLWTLNLEYMTFSFLYFALFAGLSNKSWLNCKALTIFWAFHIKNFFFHFKCYNLAIRVVTLAKIFSTNVQILTPKGLIVRGVTKPVLGSVTWFHTIFRFIETFCEDASRHKLCVGTNFIIFGPTDQKLWMFKVFRRSMGRAGMCYSQPTRVDYISSKRWAVGIRNLENSPLRVSSPIFWSLPLCLEVLNLPFLIEFGDFTFFQILFLQNLEYTWAIISTIGIFVLWKIEITKISQELLVLWKFSEPFFSAGCIWVCSTHHLPLRFGTRVLNLMCIRMVQIPKIA
jgi:hypothetical protein